LSNHDEVRTRTQLNQSLAKTKLAAAVLLTSGGSPYVYYGEELGYIGNKTQGDEYVRSPMLWGDQYTTTYTDKIDQALYRTVATVPEQAADTASLLTLYRTFAKVRNTYPALATGSTTEHPVYNQRPIFVAAHWGVVSYWQAAKRCWYSTILEKIRQSLLWKHAIDHAVLRQGNVVYKGREKRPYVENGCLVFRRFLH